jgi:pimeloyl-ACP methyl ester carboxylesterase
VTRWLLLVATLLLGAAVPAPDSGRFVEIAAVPSANIAPPHVVVWLPPGYDAGHRRYPVVYMHDGQNLFFPERSNFKKVWAADKSALRLIAAKKVAPLIIVGIDQPGPARYRQYFPQALHSDAPPQIRSEIERLAGGPLYGDAYLKFLVSELKPLIDREYRTLPDRRHTAIIGSSMGGLISCYAITQYPHVFGKAGCVSTHWPLGDPASVGPYSKDVTALWSRYFAKHLGTPNGRRIWMDHGDQTLDAAYAPYQKAVDADFVRARWRKDRDFASRAYPGAAHEENAWAARMDDIFAWLMR